MIHWAGKFDGNEESLPKREHPEGYVPFKEAENMKSFAVIANIAAGVMILLLLGSLFLRVESAESLIGNSFFFGMAASFLCLVPHEFLHAVWLPGESYVYTNLEQGMLFVVGTSDMTKARFIIMSLFPNIVFGLIPYILFMIFPQLTWAGTMGALSLGMGVGDYYNVINAAKQMPKGALTYLSGFHSYWYMPKEKAAEITE